MVFDKIRHEKVASTPEEIVRQWFIDYLINVLHYPKSLINVEREFCDNNSKKYRYDIVVYDSQCQPFILVECKARNVKITEETFLQAAKYNKTLKAKYIILTNVDNTFCWEHNSYEYKRSIIPEYH
ncbi:MAG: type I restriction enzyme HsdR N-terminal domain-containing protein [Cytophagales bacterium]|nr:type I restriction enzyme HsdR N-terminal domain-containing protein [Cytophagales bacterium]